ncbi:MAG: hypothetical protein K9L86_06485 [Candidatus Omnitrophica bacterium]|nr:hypothetical protein [Candidatus Omnitrophota bacterium]
MNKRKITGAVMLLFSFLCLACSPFEVVRLFGVGTKPFKEKGKIYTKTINKSFFESYDLVVDSFGQMQANFYRGSRKDGFIIFTNFNVSFPQANASTEVAVFLSESGPNNTQIQVSSLNYSLSDFVAEELFKSLE